MSSRTLFILVAHLLTIVLSLDKLALNAEAGASKVNGVARRGIAATKDCVEKTRYVQYQRTKNITADNLPQHKIASRCDASSSLGEHLLVTSSFKDNTTWMEEHISVPYIVYHAGDKARSHHYPNLASEAMGYLTFIAEYYDCLPQVTLFAHAHRKSTWHSTHTLDYNIRRVRWDAVPGFAALHRSGMWWDQYVKNTTLNLDGMELPYEESNRAEGKCLGLINGTAYIGRAFYQYMRGEWISMAWDTLFEPAGLGEVMDRTRCPIAAEFFVTRERIRARPREFYLKAISWVITSKDRLGLTRYEAGCVFEHLWHVIFGEPAFMEELTIAECDLYDCNL